MYMNFFGWEIHVKYKKITTNHKEQVSQVNDFSTFVCMEDATNWG